MPENLVPWRSIGYRFNRELSGRASGTARAAVTTQSCLKECVVRKCVVRIGVGVAFHFVHAASFAEDRQIGDKPTDGYSPILTGPEATGGVREYGVQVAGTWEGEVEKALSADHPEGTRRYPQIKTRESTDFTDY
jgi:hypothetical protein